MALFANFVIGACTFLLIGLAFKAMLKKPSREFWWKLAVILGAAALWFIAVLLHL